MVWHLANLKLYLILPQNRVLTRNVVLDNCFLLCGNRVDVAKLLSIEDLMQRGIDGTPSLEGLSWVRTNFQLRLCCVLQGLDVFDCRCLNTLWNPSIAIISVMNHQVLNKI